MKTSAHEPLRALLDEWQPRVEVEEKFAAVLRQRLRERRHCARSRCSIAAVAAAAAMLLAFISMGRLRPAPAAHTAEQIAVVQDLQLLNRNAELIEHLDFLSAASGGPATDQD